MKLTIEKSTLLNALQKVQSIVGQRSTLPILSNVLLKAEGDTISLTTTDMEVCVKTDITANIDDCTPGACLNGGTCVDGINDSSCNCTDGWEGEDCSSKSTQVDEKII